MVGHGSWSRSVILDGSMTLDGPDYHCLLVTQRLRLPRIRLPRVAPAEREQYLCSSPW
jgi:hypothetical protein